MVQWRLYKQDDTRPETEAQLCRVTNLKTGHSVLQAAFSRSIGAFSLRTVVWEKQWVDTEIGDYKQFKWDWDIWQNILVF